MTSMTISLGAVRLSVRLGASGGAVMAPPLPETVHALDLARRLRLLIGVEEPARLRLVAS